MLPKLKLIFLYLIVIIKIKLKKERYMHKSIFIKLEEMGFNPIQCQKVVLNYFMKGKSEEEILSSFQKILEEKNPLNNCLLKEGYQFETSLEEYYDWK